MNSFLLKYLPIFVFALAAALQADEFPEPVNTQAADEHPPSPTEMLDLFELPPGFKVTLFAGEPDVQQPIAFDFDDYGRIWVAENYTYSARGKVDQVMRDRVIILHDKDGDGQHDERKVFWDKGKMLTGLTWGYGGLWILNDGNLSFIPDKNGDDVPDSEPVPMLNGWTKNAGHNVVNGLLWGPDGWLYGRHGITDTSYPGTIDTPKEERKPLNCGIWRFHPVKHTFEIVCHGTTNPWGLDYNEVGDMFMSNNVIGHLWHVIPGAHYQRMFGQDFNPHCYELMGPISDHYHWDESGKWNESRDGKADDLGGGHSHCGLMLYYGQNFPKEYWGKAFMCNTHGRCVNVDRIERKGSSYVAKHEPNFLKVNTPWFRGVQLAYGPAGCVYLSDWSDNGECHDHDGVHRTSGRIYRISYGEVRKEKVVGLSKLESFAVGDWTWGHESEWHQRREFRGLAEQGQACSREIVEDSKSMLRMDRAKSLGQLVEPDGFDARALSLVHIANALSPRLATSILLSRKPKVRAMAVRVVTQSDELTDSLREVLIGLAKLEKSPEVLLEFAIALQHLSFKDENSIGREIAKEMLFDNPATADMSDDPVLRSMIWFGVEPHWRLFDSLWEVQDKRLLGLCTRRLAAAWPLTAERILSRLRYHIAPFEFTSDEEALDFVERTKVELRAIIEGLKGLDVPPLSVTNQTKLHSIAQDFREFAVPEVKTLFNHLQVTLDGSNGIQHLLELVRDRNEDGEARSRAIETLARVKNELTIPIVLSLLNDRAVYVDICKALAAFDDDPRIPKELLKRWNNLRHGAKEAATDTLCSRKSYAVEFTKAIVDGRVDSGVLTATQVRQLNAFGDESITAVVNKHWGVINETPEAIHASIARWKERLTDDVLAKADLASGAELFKKTCANCHRLYGEGGKIGPDLTGGNRANMDYLLGNIIDPSAEVPKQYTTSVIALKSGRVITGVVVSETASVLSVQTDKELMKIAVSDVDERTRTNKSLMPDGLLDSLTPEQVRDLIAFVQQRR